MVESFIIDAMSASRASATSILSSTLASIQ